MSKHFLSTVSQEQRPSLCPHYSSSQRSAVVHRFEYVTANAAATAQLNFALHTFI